MDLPSTIAALSRHKTGRRYPPKLRAQIRDYRRERQAHSLKRIARELGMSLPTLKRILGEEKRFIPIQVREETSIVIRTGPLRIEGLTRDDVAYILKALAC